MSDFRPVMSITFTERNIFIHIKTQFKQALDMHIWWGMRIPLFKKDILKLLGPFISSYNSRT